MKSAVLQKSFAPVSISLTFETQKELDVFASILNSTPIAETFNKLTNGSSKNFIYTVTPTLQECGANPSAHVSAVCDEISNHPAIRLRR